MAFFPKPIHFRTRRVALIGRLFRFAPASPWSGGVTCGSILPYLDSLSSIPRTKSDTSMTRNKHNPFAAITDSPLRSKKGWLLRSPIPAVFCGWLCTTLALWQFLPLLPSVIIASAWVTNMVLWSELRRL